MKNLLMATDLSARSDRALERAVALAREHGARLTVIHVVDEDLSPRLAEAQEQAAQQALDEHIGSLRSDGSPEIDIEIVFGRAHEDILALTEKTGAEMIVLGMHRDDGSREMFRGTTVERVIRAGTAPTLLVKERAARPYRKVMVAVDFSVYSRRAIEFAVNFAPDGEFHLVHAYDVPFKGFLYGRSSRSAVSQQHQAEFEQMIEGEMATFLETMGPKAPSFDTILEEGTVREVIHRQVGRLKPDVLVIGTHGRTGVARAVLGSVAEDLLNAPPCDVLAVRAW